MNPACSLPEWAVRERSRRAVENGIGSVTTVSVAETKAHLN
jgi:hypothetical protein